MSTLIFLLLFCDDLLSILFPVVLLVGLLLLGLQALLGATWLRTVP